MKQWEYTSDDEKIKTQTLGHHDESYHKYSELSRDASLNDDIFSNFKRDPDYTYMLEHTSPSLGEHYVTLLLNEYEDALGRLNWEEVKLNDKYGGTTKYNFTRLSSFCKGGTDFSPTTIHYLYLSLRMLKDLKKYQENEIDVLEIGGGYGGQCYMFYVISNFYNIDIKSYTLIDLNYAISLQRKYISKLGLANVKFLPCDEFDDLKSEIKNVDYVISNYALSEMSSNWSEKYLNDIVKKSKHGFFQFNTADTEKGTLKLSKLTSALPEHHNVEQDPGMPDSLGGEGAPYCKLVSF